MEQTQALTNSCTFCKAITNSQDKIFSEKEIESFIKGIYKGTINIRKLDVDVYNKIAEHLTKGVFRGYGKDIVKTQFGTPDYKMLESLRENVYVFSAAKSYQQTKEISSLLITKNGTTSFANFKKEAEKVFTTYNENYLSVEYNSAIAQARMASTWSDIEKDKDVYNQLEYLTAGDSHVRQEHSVLNGIIRPVNDKFWSVYYPPNGWNCRCTVLQATGEKNTDLSTKEKPTEKEVPKIFRFNSGQDKIIYSKEHPYFEVAKQDKAFAKKNFNMPLPVI